MPAMLSTRTPTAVLENQRSRLLALVFLAAFIVQAAILFIAAPKLGAFLAPEYSTGFGDLYDLIANNLVHGNGYRIEANMGETMMREPGYPSEMASREASD